MAVFEFILAIIEFVLKIALCVVEIPFIPIVWVIREIKAKPCDYNGMKENAPKITLKSDAKK